MSEEIDEKEPSASSKPKRLIRASKEKESDYWMYRKSDTGQLKKIGSFPASVIGEPAKVNLPGFMKKICGSGDYRAEIRNSKGHFTESFEFSITEDAPAIEATPTRRTIEVEQDFEDEDEFDYQSNNNTDIQNLLLQQKVERLEAELIRQESVRHSSQDKEMQFLQLILAQQEQSRARETALLDRMFKMSQAAQYQQQQPQQSMTQTLKELLILHRGIQSLGDELAPPTKPEPSGSLLGDAVQLVDSLKDIAPTILPIILGAGRQSIPTAPANPNVNHQPTAQPASNKPNLSELFAQGNAEQNGGNEE